MEYTEEEKKAIENLRKSISINDCFINHDLDAIFKETMKISINIVLNIIEKQQKEIEKKEQRLIITREAYDRVVLEVVDLEENSIPKEVIRERIKELEENVKDFEETDNTGRFTKEKCRDYDRLLELKELLGE